jgi:hypothetical protein
LELPVWR